MAGRGGVGGVWDRLLGLGMGGVLDAGHGLFGLLALLEQDERKLALKRGKKRTDGVCRLFGLRGHLFTRTAADGTATENDWERVGSESGRRERRIRGGGDSHGNKTKV